MVVQIRIDINGERNDVYHEIEEIKEFVRDSRNGVEFDVDVQVIDKD